jgi:hypothetical protein
MEQELQPFLENGYLTTLGRNKYLESKKTVRLNAAGQIESILYEGDYLKPIIRYTQLNKDIDEYLKGKKQKRVDGTLTLDADINKQVDIKPYEKDIEITADEIDF